MKPFPYREFFESQLDSLVKYVEEGMIVATMSDGRFVWFDYVSNDAPKAHAFFSELFNWKAKNAPLPGGRSYTMIALGDTPIGGYTQPPPVHTHWLSYLQVADARATADKVMSLGGTVVKRSFPVGDVATMALVVDPLGAAFALWQPNQVHDGGDYKGIDGAWIWNELYTDARDRSVAFYKAIGGFEVAAVDMGGGDRGSDRYEILMCNGKGHAGIIELRGVAPHWMPYVQVADTDATVDKAKKLGAKVKKLQTVPGLGRLAVFIDPQGAPFGILQHQPK
jgi:predicted enzyme related to lactoylglutathione lyase